MKMVSSLTNCHFLEAWLARATYLFSRTSNMIFLLKFVRECNLFKQTNTRLSTEKL